MHKEKLQAVSLKNIKIKDNFWSRYVDLVNDKIIPYQWDILNDRIEDCETSHCLANFKIAAGIQEGNFYGAVFQDTDVAKWLEAVAYSLETSPDKELEKKADKVIELIGKAQQSDGYINTYFTIVAPDKRWSNLQEGHELYTAGHLLEAAVAYYYATGKDEFLKIMQRFADYICEVFTKDMPKAYPGHQEIEIGLIKLYRVTGEIKYLDMAKQFIDRRGLKPNYFDLEREKLDQYIFPEFKEFDRSYSQSHIPVYEQKAAEGHAVRAVYMYMAMADLAYEYEDERLMQVCDTLWDNIVKKRMYITGSIGSSGFGERFTCDYDLPNDINYSETCASIGLALFGLRMAQIKKDAKYVEIVERALYNTVLAGIGLEGKSFFYVNPLEVWPESCMEHTSKRHVKPERQKWFGVACCPPNIARTLASLGQYIYASSNNHMYINLFISNQAKYAINNKEVAMSIETEFPNTSKVRIIIETGENTFSLYLRIPSYAQNATIIQDGQKLDRYEMKNGYAILHQKWDGKVIIDLAFDMPAILVRANPKVRADIGKVAIMKGPVVYCLEEIDNGDNLVAIELNDETKLEEQYEEHLLGGALTVTTNANKISMVGWGDELYKNTDVIKTPITLKAIPYCLWNNRGKGEMLVWMRCH